MANDGNGKASVSVGVSIGTLAGLLLLAGAGAAYAYFSREGAENPLSGLQRPGPRKGFPRKVGLMALASMIENDATRKVLVALLRAIARRA